MIGQSLNQWASTARGSAACRRVSVYILAACTGPSVEENEPFSIIVILTLVIYFFFFGFCQGFDSQLANVGGLF